MKRAATGQVRDAAPERILLSNRSRFLAFLERKTGDRAAAEDLLQGAYAQLLKGGTPPIHDGGAVAWFQAVLRNAWIDRLRRQAAGARAVEQAAADPDAFSDEDARRAVCACLADAVEALRPEYARILREVDLSEVSPSEVARRTGLTKSNTRVRLHRARSALRKQLERLCGMCAAHGCLDCSCKGTGTSGPAPVREARAATR